MSSSPGGSSFDASKISRGTWVAGIGALVLLISCFFPWAGVDTPIGSATQNATDYVLGWLAILAALAILAVIAIELFAPQVTLPTAPSLIIIGLGVIAIICVGWHVLFLSDDVDVGDAAGALGVDSGRKWGVFVAFIAAVASTVGGYFKLNE